MENEAQVLTVAAKWSIDLLLSGKVQGSLVSPDVVREAARGLIQNYDTERRRQASYAESIERAMAYFDDIIYGGTWYFIRATADDPFYYFRRPRGDLGTP
jgi:hypothetical protein